MITVFKIFENLDILEKGNFVYIHKDYDLDLKILPYIVKDFIINNIGKIIEIDNQFEPNIVTIKFFNIPNELKKYFKKDSRFFDITEILEFGKTKKELELKLKAKKYNIL
jgi:hypothetical protein